MGERVWTAGERVVVVLAMAAVAFIALAVTGTLPLPPPSSAGAAKGCTEYQYVTCVDANIQISPAADTNPVGTTHVLTIRVNAIDGTSTIGILGNGRATAKIQSGPGSFVGPARCDYIGGGATASCTVTITSTAIGTTVISAESKIMVSGQDFQRTTGTPENTAAGGSGNASKTWVDATQSALQALEDDIDATTAVKQGLRDQLTQKLDDVQKELAKATPKQKDYCKKLDEFVKELDAKTGKDGLTAAQAAIWRGQANAIRVALGC